MEGRVQLQRLQVCMASWHHRGSCGIKYLKCVFSSRDKYPEVNRRYNRYLVCWKHPEVPLVPAHKEETLGVNVSPTAELAVVFSFPAADDKPSVSGTLGQWSQ